MTENHSQTLPAVRIYNTQGNQCAFEHGVICLGQRITAYYFLLQSHIDDYEKKQHPAPVRQYVITLKGKLRFTVSDGQSFLIEPGIVLIAEDVMGSGHSWELCEGDEWLRIYIPIPSLEEAIFTAKPHIS